MKKDKLVNKAEPLKIRSLAGMVDYIREEADRMPDRMILQICSPAKVRLVSALNAQGERKVYAVSKARIPRLPLNRYMEGETFRAALHQSIRWDREVEERIFGENGNVELTPVRTFEEVEQPMSRFLHCCKEKEGRVMHGLMETDAGSWQREAVKRVKAYLEKELAYYESYIVIS